MTSAISTITNPSADRLYTSKFFQVWAAVALFMTGVALQFHFGQYVEYLGYGVDTLGMILSVSMVGTLLFRLHVGKWIDRFGCRPTWFVGAMVVALTVGSIQFTERLWLIAMLRTISTMASSAVMTTVAVFAATIAPPGRRAESIGTMGLAGFIGMIAGPTLGDWIFSDAGASIVPYRVFFSVSAACGLLAGGAIMLVSLPQPHGPTPTLSAVGGPSRSVRMSQTRVVVKHWPGAILLVGVVFAMAFCLQSVYLERLAEVRGFKDIKVFFLTYCPVAMTLRIVFRRLPEQMGRSRTLLMGMLLLAGGELCLIGIRFQWQLVLPGLLMGAGHSFIFPSMVDLGAERLPDEFRGTGTALILGAGDVGMLIGFVALGELIDAFGFDTAVVVLAATVLTGAGLFALARRRDVFIRKSRGSEVS